MRTVNLSEEEIWYLTHGPLQVAEGTGKHIYDKLRDSTPNVVPELYTDKQKNEYVRFCAEQLVKYFSMVEKDFSCIKNIKPKDTAALGKDQKTGSDVSYLPGGIGWFVSRLADSLKPHKEEKCPTDP